MISFDLPTREQHAMYVKNGLTSTTYDEIVAKKKEIENIDSELSSLLNSIASIVEPYDDFVRTGEFISHATKKTQELYKAFNADTLNFTKGNTRSRQDMFPIKEWDKEIKRGLKLIKQIKSNQ